jgi:alpha-glucosidase
VLGVRADGTAFGALADTTWPCSVDLNGGITFASEAPTLPVICFDGPNAQQVLVAMQGLSGIMEMPPRWALGLLVVDQKDPAAAAAWVREAGVPADAVWLAGGVADEDLAGESLSAATAAALKAVHERQLHSVLPVRGMLRAPAEGGKDHWVHSEHGQPLRTADGLVMPDFSMDATRTWWAERVRRALNAGIDGFAGPLETGASLSSTALLRGDDALGGAAAAPRYQSVFGTLMTRATWAGAGGEQDRHRPMVMSTVATLTSQRNSGVLVDAGNGGPRAALAAALSCGLSGMPLVGMRGPAAADAAEWTRWMGLASVMPLAILERPAQDGGNSGGLVRRAFERRSRLIPYYYSLAFFAFRFGDPILGPVFHADPSDASLRGIDTMFLAGKDLLVVPRLSGEPKQGPPLKGRWRKIDLGDGEHPDLPDLYLRPGAILPLGAVMQWTDQKALDPLTLLVNLDDAGQARGELYEDSGEGYAFYRNECRRIVYQATTQDGSVFIRLGALDGGLPLSRRGLEVRILTDQGEVAGRGSERGTIKIDLPVPKKEP